MADHQRVHPAQDVEANGVAPPTPEVPLVPRGTAKSDETHHRRHHPATRPPKNVRRRRSCCCKFFCWTTILLILLVVAVAASAGILYLVFRPKLPDYSVDELAITRFNSSGENQIRLFAEFRVNITAVNPNDKIGIYYVAGSHISVWYQATKLTQGALPVFYQGHRNTTVLEVPLSGQTDNAAALLGSVQDEVARNGYVPLTLRVRQPVRVKLGKLKLFKVKFLVRCRLNVDNLSASSNIRIRNSTCNFRLRL